MTQDSNELKSLLDAFLACPTTERLKDFHDALRGYQSAWITGHADPAAIPAPAPSKPTSTKPAQRVSGAERAVLERMASGWTPTMAELPRWAWFEDRELVRLAPDPATPDRHVLTLTEDGWLALGRTGP